MDNKLFFIVFKNKVLFQLIISNVCHIHRDILFISENNIFKRYQLLNNLYLLSYHNYLNEIKQHHNSIEAYVNVETLIEYITRGDSLDVLQYFINQKPIRLNINNIHTLSVKYNSETIFNYLESFTNNDKNSFKSKASGLSPSFEVRWDYYRSLSVVPISGNIELFIYILDKIDIRGTLLNMTKENKDNHSDIIESIKASAEYGRTEILNHIFGFFESDMYLLEDLIIDHIPSIFERIIKNGHLNIIKQYFNSLLIQNKLKDEDLLSECIKYNQFEMMKYFHVNKFGSVGVFFLDKPIDYAIKNGNLEMIKWLHYNLTEGCTTKAMDKAAQNGYLEIVKWLHENRTEGCTTKAMNYAAINEDYEMIKWLHYNRTEGCKTKTMDNAAWDGHLEIIKWLHEYRSEGCTTNVMDYAALNGHLEIIKWLHENRTEGCTTNSMDFATNGIAYSYKNRTLEIIEWFYNRVCQTLKFAKYG